MKRSIVKSGMFAALAALGLAAASVAAAEEGPVYPGSFAENPIVYFVITDRFYNGNPDNDRSYGREPDGEEEVGTFHGGDLAGLSHKLREGYFRDLGINALWITAPYEQIHGWVVGGENAFRHYAYHGYYALDYTQLDQNMGTSEELREFIRLAHADGIRVVFDIVMNHPGYGDLWTLDKYGVDVVWDGFEAATPRDYHSHINYNSRNWTDWWGDAWVRSDLPGYRSGNHRDPLTMQLAYLPDFRTEATEAVELPVFLRNKWEQEGRLESEQAALAEWFEQTGRTPTVRNHLIKWLTDWVREYGVDGFRADTVKHVEKEAWAELKAEAVSALEAWKQANPEQAIDDAPFWMTGEYWGHGVERSDFFDYGFDNMINFGLQERANLSSRLDAIYARYAEAATPEANFLSYISSHDTHLYPRERLIEGGTVLLLAPGGVKIFYGDETARPAGPAPASDPDQATRSPMNWDAIDEDVLAHWQTLTQFRARHVALAQGEHRRLSNRPYTFSRTYGEDRVVVAVEVNEPQNVAVGDAFSDGETVRDFYTRERMTVMDGQVFVEPHANGVVLLERAGPSSGSPASAP
ncbi:alpha-amylase [Alkalilimnicola ehrlichii]|uniref:Alpha-amylase n=1 Tax=Alkalilimnicola ehrlichii TaxID=351052 RepID=A0A3E0WHH5_9GAMM|nr:alpha-amylase family glycosyl hydrolase [Alkalilimnicola ehrlichii]RFA25299.1 alpha-amylase [Alkalilimnicola ehrlichii]RFA32412.1 alpha-amylase [Alkalilimnicola ehrlichii]